MRGIKVVPLPKKDVSSVHSLLYNIIEEMYSGNYRAIKNYKNQYTIKRMNELAVRKDGYCFIAKMDNKVIGFGLGYIFGGVGFLHWLGIDKKYRLIGIGSLIVNSIHQYFRRNKCHKSGVYTDSKNERLVNFYKKKGYRIRARLHDHWFHLNVVYLVKKL